MRSVVRIVVHYTASVDVPASTIKKWHLSNGWRDIGYHKVIRKDGSIEEGRPEGLPGAHTKGFNKESLAVVLTGSNRTQWYPADPQLTALRLVIDQWKKKYHIREDQIFLHRQLNSTECPGRLELKDIPPSPNVRRRKRMIQSGKKIGWPRVRAGDQVIVGNPHDSKSIVVNVRVNQKEPYELTIAPTASKVAIGVGYVNLRSKAVIDSELVGG